MYIYAVKQIYIGDHNEFLKTAEALRMKLLIDLQENSNHSKFLIKFIEIFFNRNDGFADIFLVMEYCKVNQFLIILVL